MTLNHDRPITSCKPLTPEERTSQSQQLVEILRKPAPCYGRALDDALAFVTDLFRYKTRKGTDIPYLTHLLAVMALVGEYGGSEEQMIAALLHDTLEDIEGITRDDLELRFGGPVTDMVVALGDTTEHPKPDWRTRKGRYLARLAQKGPWVKLVSAADKLHNAQCLHRDLARHGDAVWARFNAGRKDQLWYYRSVVEALAHGWDDPLLKELRDAVSALEVVD
jgi:GTP pyrophosphokinase